MQDDGPGYFCENCKNAYRESDFQPFILKRIDLLIKKRNRKMDLFKEEGLKFHNLPCFLAWMEKTIKRIKYSK